MKHEQSITPVQCEISCKEVPRHLKLVESETELKSTCVQVEYNDNDIKIPLQQIDTRLIKSDGIQKDFLKYNKADDVRYSRKRSVNSVSDNNADNPKKRKKSKQIKFDECVDVMLIPAKEDYDEPIKCKIWASSHEIHENAARNAVEFISEGWNWRNVKEDEAMHLCVATGERIHPIHYANLGIEPGEWVL